MKAAGYVRVSTEQQREEQSHERQRERLDEWGQKNDYNIEIYQDIAISGQAESRPEYNDLMASLDSYDAVVVRELSRFGRDLQQVISDIEELEEHDVDFISLKENLDTTTAQGQLLFHVIGAFNQFWADLARERTNELIQRKREQGEGWGPPKKLDELQLEQVYEWRDTGLSYQQIAVLIEQDVSGQFKDVDSIDKSTIYRYCQDRDEAAAD